MRLAAIVLAAGRSRRFGTANKLLADLAGQPVIAHTMGVIGTCGFNDVVTVTGEAHAKMAALLLRYRARAVRCPLHRDGIGDSIATGIAALDGTISGALIVPADMPLLTPHSIGSLLDTFRAYGGEQIIYAADRAGAQRNPVVWPAAYFTDLSSLTGPTGAKSILAQAGSKAVAVVTPDETEFIDIDALADLETARTILRDRLNPY